MSDIRITDYIHHSERLSRGTVEELRALVERYPYYQTARLLLLENLYLIHDASFNAELHRSAPLLADRRVLFKMIEGRNYDIPLQTSENEEQNTPEGDRTISLIDKYLNGLPQIVTSKHKTPAADPTQDYAAYLMQQEGGEEEQHAYLDVMDETPEASITLAERQRKNGRIVLPEEPENKYVEPENEGTGEEYFTETLAQIYIKQQKYGRALEIIKTLNLNNPKKSAYFADQIRFLQKLILIQQNQK